MSRRSRASRSPADAAAFKSECEAIADTLQITSGNAFPVGPDPAYAKTLGTIFGELGGQVANGRKQITSDAATFRRQAAAARDIQRAYVAAAKQLRGTETSPADATINAAIAERLTEAGAAWKQAAAAAADKDKSGFDSASDAIKQAQANLATTLSGLETIGYELDG